MIQASNSSFWMKHYGIYILNSSSFDSYTLSSSNMTHWSKTALAILALSLTGAIGTTHYFGCIPYITSSLLLCQQVDAGEKRKGWSSAHSGLKGNTEGHQKSPDTSENQSVNEDAKNTPEKTPLSDEQNPYSSTENRLETHQLDIQSLEERRYDLLREQLNRDSYLDPSFLR